MHVIFKLIRWSATCDSICYIVLCTINLKTCVSELQWDAAKKKRCAYRFVYTPEIAIANSNCKFHFDKMRTVKASRRHALQFPIIITSETIEMIIITSSFIRSTLLFTFHRFNAKWMIVHVNSDVEIILLYEHCIVTEMIICCLLTPTQFTRWFVLCSTSKQVSKKKTREDRTSNDQIRDCRMAESAQNYKLLNRKQQ